jgi:aquaporin Z
MTRKLIVEAIGTFFLVLTIGLVVVDPALAQFAPLAIGVALTVLVYAGAHISGAHYNPAVTAAIWLRGRASGREVAGYWGAQVIGAAAAAVTLPLLTGPLTVNPSLFETRHVLVAEFLFTFLLAYVILNVATARGTQGNSHYGLSIGFTVMAGAYAVGGISGAVFNPAVAVGLLVLGGLSLASLWGYLAATFAGALAAAALFNALDLGNDKPTESTVEEQSGLRPAAEPAAPH